MILPGMAGGWLDRQLSTNYWMPIGFALGVAAGTALLVLLARLLTPPAGGTPLNSDDESSDDTGDTPG